MNIEEFVAKLNREKWRFPKRGLRISAFTVIDQTGTARLHFKDSYADIIIPKSFTIEEARDAVNNAALYLVASRKAWEVADADN